MADQRKEQLIRELDEARALAGANRRGLAVDLQFGDKIKRNLSRFRGVWLTGALLVGVIISKIPARTKKVVVPRGSKTEREVKQAGKAGLLLAALKMAFDFGKPFITAWIAKKMKAPGRPQYGMDR